MTNKKELKEGNCYETKFHCKSRVPGLCGSTPQEPTDTRGREQHKAGVRTALLLPAVLFKLPKLCCCWRLARLAFHRER